MDRLQKFNICNFRDRLTILKEERNQLVCECPVCGGRRLTIDKETGKYRCWSGGCDCKDIRDVIAPLDDNNKPRRQIAKAPKGKPTQKPKPPAPPSDDVHLVRLLAPTGDG